MDVYLDGAAADEFWSDEYDDDDGYDDDPDITLASIAKSKTINFSIRASYTNWKPREAFRELVQNWRDGIIRTFNLAERDFCVIREERTKGRETEIVYKVPRLGADDQKEWLGYIRFLARDGEGTIEITNRSVTLQPWHLDLGGTSKAGDEHQAGAHGEGLKIALLVLMRSGRNHKIRCRTGGFNWNFNFTSRGRLVARLTRMTPDKILQAKDQAQRLIARKLPPFAVSADRDVQFIIGEAHKGRDEWGETVKRDPVHRRDFDAWTKACLFLQDAQDGSIVSTDAGDLLTTPALCGKIYLKGLLLAESTPSKSASISSLPLKFGYNFASGKTNRERQSVASSDEESRAILAIWEGVLATKPEMAKELSALLDTAEPQYADVFGPAQYMGITIASCLRDYLFGEQFKGKWYYCSEEKDRSPRLNQIIQGLGCEGVKLTKRYWDILRGQGLVRTALEEEQRRFTTAPLTPVDHTTASSFSTSVCRLLCACMRACPHTNGMEIAFVQAGQLRLHLFFSKAEGLFRIHERWLCLDGARKELNQPGDLIEPDVIFHTVKLLFANALAQLSREAFFDEGDASTSLEWRMKLEIIGAEQRLLNYQRIEKLTVCIKYSGLQVAWAVGSRLKIGDGVEIQCHRVSRCGHLRNSLLIAEDARLDKMLCIAPEDNSAKPQQGTDNVPVGSTDSQLPSTCRVHRRGHRTGWHFEADLKVGEEYFFVLLTPNDPASFLMLSPNVKCPDRPVPEVANNNNRRDISRPPYPHRSLPGGPPPTTSATAGKTSQPASKTPSTKPQNSTLATTATPAKAAKLAGNTIAMSLGAQLQNLDIFQVDRDRWYNAELDGGEGSVRAVVGFLHGQKSLPEEMRKRKRPRTDTLDA